MQQFLTDWQSWAWPAARVVAVATAGILAHLAIYALASRAVKRIKSEVDDSLVRHSRGPMGLILPIFAVKLAFPALPGVASHALSLLVIAAIAWLVMRLTNILEDVLSYRYRMDVADNLRARRIHTQLQVIRRIVGVIVIVIAVSAMLMTFPNIRQLGASILASAGIAGVIVGMAARPTLANLLAGVQIALTQPIRLDDVVVVEGEWGRIEEITTTYVVVRIWDLRRLVLPLSYFIEKPFQNWTRRTADILGTVYIYADYTVPVEEVRKELKRIVKGSALWDGKVCGLQVTDASESTVSLRPLISAADSGKAWDLRCLVREKLIEFLQKRYPECLPKTRAELRRVPGEEEPAKA